MLSPELKPDCISPQEWDKLVASDLTFDEIEAMHCEEVAINAGIARDPDAEELDESFFANARPAIEVEPEWVEYWSKMKAEGKGIPTPDDYRIAQRVGLIVPSTNTVMEPDLYRNLPRRYTTLHTSRMLLEGNVTIAAEELMLDQYLPQCARQIATLRPDVVVFGCTSAGALRGPAYEQQLAAELTQTTGAPTVTIMGAVVNELRRIKPDSVAVLTPYSPEINDTIKDSLETSGFPVTHLAGMDIQGAYNIAAVTPQEILDYVREQMDGVATDCLFISCANLRSVEILDDLRKAVRRPVVTSNQAVLAGVRQALNATASWSPTLLREPIPFDAAPARQL